MESSPVLVTIVFKDGVEGLITESMVRLNEKTLHSD